MFLHFISSLYNFIVGTHITYYIPIYGYIFALYARNKYLGNFSFLLSVSFSLPYYTNYFYTYARIIQFQKL